MIIRIDGLLECPDGRRSAALSYNDGAHTAVALQFNSDDDPAAAALCTIMHCNENLSVFWQTPFKQICSDLPPQEVSLENGNWPNGDQWDGRRKVWTGGRKGWTVNWFQLIPQLMSPPWVSMSPPGLRLALHVAPLKVGSLAEEKRTLLHSSIFTQHSFSHQPFSFAAKMGILLCNFCQ